MASPTNTQAAELLASLTHPKTAIAFCNLAEQYISVGELARADTASADAAAWADRFGDPRLTAQAAATRATMLSHTGGWDEALELIDQHVDRPNRRDVTDLRVPHGWIRLARGDPVGAMEDANAILAYGRATRTFDFVEAGLALRAVVLVRADRDADQCTTAYVDYLDHTATSCTSVPYLAAVAAVVHDGGRRDELAARADRLPASSRWKPAVCATTAGRHLEAARHYHDIGARPLESRRVHARGYGPSSPTATRKDIDNAASPHGPDARTSDGLVDTSVWKTAEIWLWNGRSDG